MIISFLLLIDQMKPHLQTKKFNITIVIIINTLSPKTYASKPWTLYFKMLNPILNTLNKTLTLYIKTLSPIHQNIKPYTLNPKPYAWKP
jgi:uncharacterized membrane protein